MSSAGAFPGTIFAGRRFAVVGLGRNGLPAARALGAMGASVICWDDGKAARAAAMAAGLTVAEPAIAGCDALVLSPGIPHRLPAPHPLAVEALAAGVPILSDAELLYQAVRAAGSQARFVGITGTNGKSTTTALLADILASAGIPVAAGGNLGPAATALPLLGDDGIYVLEMSSYMLERLATLRFDAAVMLNLSADHIDRHGDMAGYEQAKRAIFDRQTEADFAVVGADDAASLALAARLPRVPRLISAERVLVGGSAFDMSAATALPGAHNAQNAAAAAAVAGFLGVDAAAIRAGIVGFPGLPHRQSLIATVGGVNFVNDSKATNADATARALGCYDAQVWIAGGIGKAGGIAALAPLFGRIARALLIGRDAPLFAATLAEHGVPHEVVGTLERAVPLAFDAARDSRVPTVLLSPAAASFDQFSGFEARGERFAELVRALAATSRVGPEPREHAA